MLSSDEIFQNVFDIMKPFDVTDQDLEEFCSKMDTAMNLGLSKTSRESSSIKMFPTYVFRTPNGTETGSFLALDLGGTNYRVLAVTLMGKGRSPKIDERTYSIPIKKMTGSGEELFSYIAETLANFLESHNLKDNHYNLGFTFSFPCNQKSLTNATLVRWTKGFSATNVVGENVAEMLQRSMDKLKISVTCVAIVNDTVGTLASCALEDPRCAVGLIVGTGTNTAYIESCKKVELLSGESCSEVVINTEWGAFGEMGEMDCWRTQFDKIVDSESLQPGKQLFEKMVSGMYLGEIVRHILVHLVERSLLFRGQLPEKLQIKDSVLTKYLTDVERDPPHLFYNTHYMLTEDLNVPVVEPIDDKVVRHVCELVVKRAASLVGAGIACILRRINRSEVTIGVDGSLYKFHPKFSQRMTETIDKLRPKRTRFYVRLSEDGSGKGAAAIAAASIRS